MNDYSMAVLPDLRSLLGADTEQVVTQLVRRSLGKVRLPTSMSRYRIQYGATRAIVVVWVDRPARRALAGLSPEVDSLLPRLDQGGLGVEVQHARIPEEDWLGS